MSRIVPNRSQSDANLIDEEHSHAGCSNTEGSAAIMDVELGIDSYKPVLLFQSEHYLVIDKPCGVRMNGEFEGTSSILPASIMIVAFRSIRRNSKSLLLSSCVSTTSVHHTKIYLDYL